MLKYRYSQGKVDLDVFGERALPTIIVLGIIILSLLVGCTHTANDLQETASPSAPYPIETSIPEKPLATDNQIVDIDQPADLSSSYPDDIPGQTTKSPEGTHTPTPTATISLAPLDGKVIILAEFPWGEFYIEDIVTGRGRPFIPEHYFQILDWGGDGCTMMVRWDHSIAEIDLQGNLVQVLFRDETIPERDGPTTFGTISPDREWVYYLVGSGAEGNCADDFGEARACYYEYNDIETMSITGEEGPYRLSQRGGAWKAAWSPDGQLVAFSDYDENGVDQLYVAARDGSSLRQLTTFSAGQNLIMGIEWSPNGERIAAGVDQTADFSVDFTIISELGKQSISEYVDIGALWWRDDDSIIAWQRMRWDAVYYNIIVLNVMTNEITTIDLANCYWVNTFGNPATVGCVTIDKEFWAYNSITQSVELYPQFDLALPRISSWIAAPDAFPGEANCRASP